MDFMILYEEKVRELESACILKMALEKEGFSAEIYSIYSLRKSLKRAKVIIVPHLYNDKQVYQFICKFKPRTCKVINLQYEQVLCKEDLKVGHGYPEGDAKNSIILAWGNHEKNRYSNDGNQDCIITGCLPMDLNLPKYDSLYYGRDYICKKYGLNSTRKLLVFISSFSLANVGEDYIRLYYNKNYQQMKVFSDISRRSKATIVKYLKKLAIEERVTVIYRPHPAEYEDDQLIELQSTTEHFHVITEESVRQWIRVSDCLVTWFSTSIVDAYYAGKPCVILRPEKIPQEIDVPFFIGAKSISTYKDLLGVINDVDDSFPIDSDEIKAFYSNEIGQECLPKLVKTCKDIYDSPKYEYTYKAMSRFKNPREIIKTFCVDILFEISKRIDLTKFYKVVLRRNNLKQDFFSHVQKELYKSDKLIEEICSRLANEE